MVIFKLLLNGRYKTLENLLLIVCYLSVGNLWVIKS